MILFYCLLIILLAEGGVKDARPFLFGGMVNVAETVTGILVEFEGGGVLELLEQHAACVILTKSLGVVENT